MLMPSEGQRGEQEEAEDEEESLADVIQERTK